MTKFDEFVEMLTIGVVALAAIIVAVAIGTLGVTVLFGIAGL